MKAVITKTEGDYIRDGKIKTGKFYRVEIPEWQETNWCFPGSWTKKRVFEVVQGNIGFDADIKYIDRLLK